MKVKIVQSKQGVTLLGGGPIPENALEMSTGLAPVLVAADGAAAAALAAGMKPQAVIGDMDSLAPETRKRIPAERLFPIPEQDSTDFDKALRSIDAPLVLAVGFTGARLDHELAVYNALVRHAENRCIVIGAHDICFHLPPKLDLSLTPGARVSLFPMAALRCSGTGLQWPVEGLDFAPWGRVGTSNAARDGQVTLRPSGAGMLVILPRAELRAAIDALAPGACG